MAFTYGFVVGGSGRHIGVNVQDYPIDTTQRFPLGTQVLDNKGRTWLYVKAGGTLVAFKMVQTAASNDPYNGVLVGTASAAVSAIIGISPRALTNGQFGWIVQHGLVEDDAVIISANLTNGQPIICSAAGSGDLCAAADINNAVGVCIIDDTDNTGTVFLY